MNHPELERAIQEYRNDGYTIIMEPRGEDLPAFLAGFHPKLIVKRGNESAVVIVERTRLEMARNAENIPMAEVIERQPGWRTDVMVLEAATEIEKAADGASEPAAEQLHQMLDAADELADRGFAPIAHLAAWGALEAVLRRIDRDAGSTRLKDASEILTAITIEGLLDREDYHRLRAADKARSQTVHGFLGDPVEAETVHFVTATARTLASEPAPALMEG